MQRQGAFPPNGLFLDIYMMFFGVTLYKYLNRCECVLDDKIFNVKGEGSMSIYAYDEQKFILLVQYALKKDALYMKTHIPTTGLNKIKVISIDNMEELR